MRLWEIAWPVVNTQSATRNDLTRELLRVNQHKKGLCNILSYLIALNSLLYFQLFEHTGSFSQVFHSIFFF